MILATSITMVMIRRRIGKYNMTIAQEIINDQSSSVLYGKSTLAVTKIVHYYNCNPLAKKMYFMPGYNYYLHLKL